MDKTAYLLTDGSGEVFDARFMDQGDYENEQRKANEATGGEYGWVSAEVHYANQPKALLWDFVHTMDKKDAVQRLDPEADSPLPYDEQDVYTWLDQAAQAARLFLYAHA
jgi:hypothetical protein